MRCGLALCLTAGLHLSGCLLPDYSLGLKGDSGLDSSAGAGGTPQDSSVETIGQPDSSIDSGASDSGEEDALEQDGAPEAADATLEEPGPEAPACGAYCIDHDNCGSSQHACAVGEICNQGICTAVGATELVQVGPFDGGTFGIDRTEVTRAQYQDFLATAPSLSYFPAGCDFAVNYEPFCSWPPLPAELNLPVGCVHWCQAYAYCASLGKRLCGRLGGGGGDLGSYADPTLSQWMNACSSGGVNIYPYGSTFGATLCNSDSAGKGDVVSVGTMMLCVTQEAGYAGVYDLSGNVWEWEDACEAGKGWTADCRVRGGSFHTKNPSCTNPTVVPRYSQFADIGFRCCSRD